MSHAHSNTITTATDASDGNVSRVLFSRDGGQSDQSGPRSLGQAPTKTHSSHSTWNDQGPMTPWGSPAGELNEDTRISVGGMTVRVKEAMRLGLVSRNAAGHLQMNDEAVAQATAKAAAETEEQAHETDPLAPAPFASAEDEQLAVRAAGEVGPELMTIGLDQIVQALANGSQEVDIEALAETHGKDPAKLQQHLMAVTEALSRQAEKHVGTKHGISHAEMVREMLARSPRDVANAMRAHAMTQNPRAWDSLAERYRIVSKQKADDDAVSVFNQRREEQAPRAIDTQARSSSRSEPLVTVDGVQMPMSFARARGFIR